MSGKQQVMPVADALADAETLRLVALDHFAPAVASGEMYRLRLQYYTGCIGAASVAAMRWPDGRPLLPEIPDAVMYEMARNDAHAAINGVPELFMCYPHEPALLDEGTFCRHCECRLPATRAPFRAMPGLRA